MKPESAQAPVIEQGSFDELQGKVKELLDSGKIQCFVGYERSSDGINTRPAFVYSSKDVDKLVLDDNCIHNLAKYLLNRKGKPTGIVVKPCGSRAINILLAEKQIKREDVVIIGTNCDGSPKTQKDKRNKTRQLCYGCNLRMPVVYDFLIGKPAESGENTPNDYSDVIEVEGKSLAERAQFWKNEFSRCIRCYACRAVCPGCYCIQCFVESLDPEWVGIKIAPAENEMWHIIRAFHLAGRCVGCNACEKVCPMKIPLSKLNRKLDKEVLRLFDFQSGLDSETPAPLATFKKEEKSGVEECCR